MRRRTHLCSMPSLPIYVVLVIHRGNRDAQHTPRTFPESCRKLSRVGAEKVAPHTRPMGDRRPPNVYEFVRKPWILIHTRDSAHVVSIGTPLQGALAARTTFEALARIRGVQPDSKEVQTYQAHMQLRQPLSLIDGCFLEMLLGDPIPYQTHCPQPCTTRCQTDEEPFRNISTKIPDFQLTEP